MRSRSVSTRILKEQGETLARYGGEEFVVLLPDTDQLHAMTMAEKMRP